MMWPEIHTPFSHLLSSVRLSAKSLKRTSVFERLGSESKTDAATANKVIVCIFICLNIDHRLIITSLGVHMFV